MDELKTRCLRCGGRIFKDVYDGGNGEGARIKVVKLICEKCAEIVFVKSRDLPNI